MIFGDQTLGWTNGYREDSPQPCPAAVLRINLRSPPPPHPQSQRPPSPSPSPWLPFSFRLMSPPPSLVPPASSLRPRMPLMARAQGIPEHDWEPGHQTRRTPPKHPAWVPASKDSQWNLNLLYSFCCISASSTTHHLQWYWDSYHVAALRGSGGLGRICGGHKSVSRRSSVQAQP